MKNNLLLAAAMAMTLVACDRPNKPPRAEYDDTSYTADVQSDRQHDDELSQKVHQAIMTDTSITNNSKNINVTTVDGVVTLRGFVSTDAEKAAIEKNAFKTLGIKGVDNQLEVKPYKNSTLNY